MRFKGTRQCHAFMMRAREAQVTIFTNHISTFVSTLIDWWEDGRRSTLLED